MGFKQGAAPLMVSLSNHLSGGELYVYPEPTEGIMPVLPATSSPLTGED